MLSLEYLHWWHHQGPPTLLMRRSPSYSASSLWPRPLLKKRRTPPERDRIPRLFPVWKTQTLKQHSQNSMLPEGVHVNAKHNKSFPVSPWPGELSLWGRSVYAGQRSSEDSGCPWTGPETPPQTGAWHRRGRGRGGGWVGEWRSEHMNLTIHKTKMVDTFRLTDLQYSGWMVVYDCLLNEWMN